MTPSRRTAKPGLLTASGLAALLIALPGLAMAQAVTYAGTLGTSPIVLEVSTPIEAASETIAGRYAYLSKGIDIPLQPISVAAGLVELGEEKPCTAEICDASSEDVKKAAPIGDTWSLATADNGQTLTGEWHGETGDKLLPIALTRVGTRDLGEGADLSPAGLASFAEYMAGTPLTADTSPYDFLRARAKFTESTETVWGDVAFAYQTDPRTKFAYPTIKRLTPGGSPADAEAANTALWQRHAQLSLSALDCKAEIYQGFGWMDGADQGTLGAYDDENVAVTYLSDKLMSWTEAGSLYCTGAHPYNHADTYLLNVATGKPLDLSQIFAGWIAPDIDPDAPVGIDPEASIGTPSPELIAYVRENRIKSGPDYDAASDAECGTNDLIDGNLSVGFAEGDKVVFGITGLPYAYSACGGTLLEVNIADLKDLLAPEAASYFPSLR